MFAGRLTGRFRVTGHDAVADGAVLVRRVVLVSGTGELPVEIAEVPDPDEAGAAPVGDETRIEIALPDGVRVRVGRGVDGAALRRVLAALGR